VLQIVAPAIPYDVFVKIKWVVSDVVRNEVGPLVPDFEVQVLWFAWWDGVMFTNTPGESWRALSVCSGLPESMYFEVTYDHLRNKYYVDPYTKANRFEIEV